MCADAEAEANPTSRSSPCKCNLKERVTLVQTANVLYLRLENLLAESEPAFGMMLQEAMEKATLPLAELPEPPADPHVIMENAELKGALIQHQVMP